MMCWLVREFRKVISVGISNTNQHSLKSMQVIKPEMFGVCYGMKNDLIRSVFFSLFASFPVGRRQLLL